MWLLWDETKGTVCFANTYNELNVPKFSWKPEQYSYAYQPKVHDPKMEAMVEQDVTYWPPFITNAKRKTKGK